MQISDMLGQYNKNITVNSADDLKGASSMQKMVSSVSQMSAGNIFEGTVNAVNGNKVTLGLSNGETITATLESKVKLSVGTPMFFQVKSNDGELVAIRPYSGAGNTGNPILLNALTAASIPVNERNLTMVDIMMKEQMPIDRQSLLDMAKIISTNQEVSVGTAVAMTKAGIPVSNEMAAQFENYVADKHAILDGMNQAMNELTGVLGSEELSADTAVRLNGEILDILSNGAPSGNTSGLPEGNSSVATADVVAATAGEIPAQTANIEGNPLINEAVQTAGESGNLAGLSGEETGSTVIAQSNGNVTASDANGNPIETQTPSLNQLLSAEQLGNLNKLLQNVPTLVENQTLFPEAVVADDIFVDTMQDDQAALPVAPELLAEEAAEAPKLDANLTVEKFLQTLQQTLAQNQDFGFAGVTKLFGSSEYQTVLRSMIEQQWLLSPEELKSEHKVSELYERLEHQMKQMETAMKTAGLNNSSFLETATDVRNNIEFMNQINQMYTYVQLPLKLAGQHANGELYVYTNKKNLNDPEAELTAFLHLDLDHLGATDVSVKLQRKNVKTNFYFDTDESYRLVKLYLPMLEEKLKAKGYSCTLEVEKEKKTVRFVDDFLKKDQPTAGVLHRYSFDVRT